MRLRSVHTRSVPALCAVILPWLVACGDEGSGGIAPEPSQNGHPSTDPDGTQAPDAEEASVYVLTTRVSSSDDQQLSYLLSVPSLDAGATFDLSGAVELESTDNNIAGLAGTPFIYVGSCTEPTITRWEAKPDGSLEKGPSVSFANLGFTDACIDTSPVYSADKAYFLPSQSAEREIAVWNPSSMELLGTIPLPDIAPEGELLPVVSLSERSDRIFATVYWQEAYDQDWTHLGDHVRIIEIDPATDSVVGQTDDTRCNELFASGATSDGTLYFSPGSYDAPVRSILGGERGVDPCLLRIVPPETSFDQGYQLDLSSLAGGRPAGDLVVLNDDVAFLHVWHSEVVDPVLEDLSNWEDTVNQAGFLWWKWTMGSEGAEPIGEQAPANGVVLFQVDGRTLVTRFSEDYTSTTLDELDPAGAISPGLSGPGQVFGVVRAH